MNSQYDHRYTHVSKGKDRSWQKSLQVNGYVEIQAKRVHLAVFPF